MKDAISSLNVWLKCKSHMNYTASSLKMRDFGTEQHPCFIFTNPLSTYLHLSNIPVRGNERRLLPAVNLFKQIKKDKGA